MKVLISLRWSATIYAIKAIEELIDANELQSFKLDDLEEQIQKLGGTQLSSSQRQKLSDVRIINFAYWQERKLIINPCYSIIILDFG